MRPIVILIATLVCFAVAKTADAQGRNCGPRAAVIDHLNSQFSETRQSMGLGSNNAVIEVFASDETGSWSITVTQPNGVTCLVASGHQFERLSEDLPPREDDT